MLLKTVYVRFFRSFNFDYLRQDADNISSSAWDVIEPDKLFYPFVTIDLESDVTTIVGANESGKSQLIVAIRCLLGDRPIVPKDFCRYSTLFGVQGGMKRPEFGGEFTDLTDRTISAIREIAGDDSQQPTSFWFFRLAAGNFLYLKNSTNQYARFSISDQQIVSLQLPVAKPIDAEVALPQNVSLYALAQGASSPRSRGQWYDIYRGLHSNESLLNTPTSSSTTVDQILPPFTPSTDAKRLEMEERSLGLARDMLIKVAQIDPLAFSELLDSSGDDDGYGEALAARITAALATSLNFERWWSQDRDFALEIRKDGFYLVLTMRDRTGQTYTFDERSSGMKYFLSYFVQYMAYAPTSSDRSEILLMDEPDAFLSTSGQQDLLRIFEAYANPEDDSRPPAQVLFVTHSPFLLDKNRPHRIRVLQKGSGDEGTRVVKKASVDKYEPLRSAFGSFHAETAFIGNCNLLVEGPADVVLLGGLSAAIRKNSLAFSALDLNKLTLVPVHGASQYRYILHLTRGRDVDRPAVIVLLDSDKPGIAARVDLDKGYKGQSIIDSKLFFAVGDLDLSMISVSTTTIEEPEDLVPVAAARAAVVHIAKEVFSEADAQLVAENLPNPIKVKSGERLFDACQKAARAASQNCARELDLQKIEFARAVPAIALELGDEDKEALLRNFGQLFTELLNRQESAMRTHNNDRLHETTKRLVERFKMDHRSRATKISVTHFLERVLQQLEDSGPQAETIRGEARRITDRFALAEDPLSDVTELSDLKRALGRLVHGARQEEEGLLA